MKGGPLTHEPAPRGGLLKFLRSHPRQVVGSGVADAIAAGLNTMHFHLREFGQDIRNFLELGPIELDVLASSEMPVAAVVAARNASESPQLRRRQETIRDRDPQHRGMALDVQTIAQAQVAKFVLAQQTCEESARLVAKLRDALVHQRFVNCVVPIHGHDDTSRTPSAANYR